MVLRTAARMSRWAAGAALLALVAAACGGDDNEAGSGEGGGSAEGSAATIEIQSIGNMNDVLVDSNGQALYTSDVEKKDSKVLCTGGCLDIWAPATLPEGQSQPPAAPSGLTGELGVVKRPESDLMQLTLDGAPLYTFSFDQPGDVKGHGTPDSFEGIDFVWSVATASGEAPDTVPTTGGYY